MPNYVISPEQKGLPEGPYLMEQLHRRGYPVEINVKGTAQSWSEIRFYEPGPPEIECLLSFNEKSGGLKVSVSNDASLEARDLQLSLVDLLLKDVGGQADNTETRERYTPEEFSEKLKRHFGSTGNTKDLLWIAFSWIVFAAGIAIYIFSPQFHGLVSIVLFLSLLSAAGLTYSHFKP